jgi:drug/metabolite transporter (DMT)-like permease
MTHRSEAHKAAITGYALAVTAVVIWAGNMVTARGVAERIPPIGMGFWRWLVGLVALAPFAARSTMADWGVIKRHLGYLSLTGLLGVTLLNTLIYTAGRTTTAINLSLIASAGPIFILLLMRVLYGEPMTWWKTLGVLTAVAGVVLLVTDGSLERLLGLRLAVGDMWMLAGSTTFAGYSVLVKRKPADLSMLSFLLSITVLGVLFLAPVYLWEHLFVRQVSFTWSTVLPVLYTGVFASDVAYLVWNRAIEMIGPARGGLVYFLIPVFSALFAGLFLGETVRPIHVASMVLIVVGVLSANRVTGPGEPAQPLS